jgi:hypothetical protein
VLHKRIGATTVKAYGCSYHQSRGPEVCPVTVRQPIEEAEAGLAGLLRSRLRGQEAELHRVIRAELARQQAPAPDLAGMQAELRELRLEQRRLLRVAAAVDGRVEELAAELGQRASQIAALEQALAAALAPVLSLDEVAAEAEAIMAGQLVDLEEALSGSPGRFREALRGAFPDGLRLHSHRSGRRHIWLVDQVARVTLVSPAGPNLLLSLGFTVAGPLQMAA